MTAAQAIEKLDRIRPNKYTAEEKLAWLNALDGRLYNEVILTHEGEHSPFSPYTIDDLTATLLAEPPYDEDIYTNYLQAQVALCNGEGTKYNQSIALYNSACLGWMQYRNRISTPLGGERFRW